MSAFGLEWVQDPTIEHNFSLVEKYLGVLARVAFFVGTGTPNGAITASPPALYLNHAGGAGTTLYVKETGVNTNTGWVGK